MAHYNNHRHHLVVKVTINQMMYLRHRSYWINLETLCVACFLSKDYQDNIYNYLKMENNQVVLLLFIFPSKIQEEKNGSKDLLFVFFSVLFLFLAAGFIQQRSKPAKAEKNRS